MFWRGRQVDVSRHLFVFALIALVSGCRPSSNVNPHQGSALVGMPFLSTTRDSNGNLMPNYSLSVPVWNTEPVMLRGNFYVQDGLSEVNTRGRMWDSPKREYLFTTIKAPMGAHIFIGLCDIKQNFSHPIRVRLSWETGSKVCNKIYVILPGKNLVVEAPK
ncbi:hypothetical protein IAD21_04631 [Abditibacteriota bacterium]|nr:hypothetical protein IAD21_04631 [Abditibacteriota bacterium]